MWLQIAIPLVIGVTLGAVVFKLTTRSVTPPAAQTATIARSSPAVTPPLQPAATPAAKPVEVQKPSPFSPNSRPASATPPVKAPPAARPVASADRTAAPSQAPSPNGSSSRVNAATPPHPVMATVEPAPKPEPTVANAAPASPPPPPPNLAPIAEPARVEHPQHLRPLATVTVEPVTGSKLGRIVGHIPGFRRKQKDFVPARPLHQVAPAVPAGEHLDRDVPVDLKVTVDPAGNVADVEQTSRGADKALVRLALDAARSWHFVPARRNDETVSSELILHFTFPGSRPPQP